MYIKKFMFVYKFVYMYIHIYLDIRLFCVLPPNIAILAQQSLQRKARHVAWSGFQLVFQSEIDLTSTTLTFVTQWRLHEVIYHSPLVLLKFTSR